ncbi:MAG: hypothetical protein QM796_06980 [Chthoniobacteraceae bacterium]
MSDDLPTIPLDRIRPCEGQLWWSSPDSSGRAAVSLKIPLEPFDSGLDYIPQPETPIIQLYDFSLDAPNPFAACGKTFDLGDTQQGGSVCIGHSHNPTDVLQLSLRHLSDALFEVRLHLYLDFEFEGVGESADLFLTATVRHVPE